MKLLPKAVLWDLDETLYSRRSAARRMFPGLFRTCLYTDRSEAFICEAVSYMMTQVKRNSMTHEDAFRALLAHYPSDKPYVRSECLDYYYAHIRDYAQVDTRTLTVLQKLKTQGVKMAIVTNITPELLEHQKKKVAQLGIAQYFDAIVYSAELGVHKPDRRIFDHAAALLGVENAHCVFVGDDPASDIAGALNAGMEAVWLDPWDTDSVYRTDPRVHRVSSVTDYFTI